MSYDSWKFGSKSKMVRSLFAPVLYHEATHYLKQWLEWKYDNKCDDNKNKQGQIKTFDPEDLIFSVYTTKNGRV